MLARLLHFTVLDCNFTANGRYTDTTGTEKLTGSGAAIATDGTRTSNLYPVNLVVRRSTFVDNTADTGGAIKALQYSDGRGRVEVHECRFFGNNVSPGERGCSTTLCAFASNFRHNG